MTFSGFISKIKISVICVIFTTISNSLAISIPIKQLTNNTISDNNPRISGSNVVWNTYDNGTYEIFFYDGIKSVKIHTHTDFLGSVQISGANVIWAENDGNDEEIFFYNGSNIIQLSDNDLEDHSPQISGENAVWFTSGPPWYTLFYYNGTNVVKLADSSLSAHVSGTNMTWEFLPIPDDKEIMFYNGTATIQLTDNNYPDVNPKISGTNVVWSGQAVDDRPEDDYEIFFYNGTEVIRLTDNAYNDCDARISGTNIVWNGNDGHDEEIFFYNGTEIIQLTDNDSDDFSPEISGSNVVWIGNGKNSMEVFFYNGIEIIQLTNNSYDDLAVDISGSNIAWSGHDGNDNEIFIAGPIALDPTTLAYWSFDSISGDTTTFYDVTGHGYNASSLNLGVIEGIKGNALKCDNENFELIVSNSIGDFEVPHFTIEAWIYSDEGYVGSTDEDGKSIFNYSLCGEPGSHFSAGYGMHVKYTGRLELSLSTTDGGVWATCTSDIILQPSVWYHVVGTYDGEEMNIYINGINEKNVAYDGGYVPNIADPRVKEAYIACSARTPKRVCNWFNGKIDELAFYNYALDPDTILAHYEELMNPVNEINLGMKNYYVQPGEELWIPVFIANYEEEYEISAVKFSLNIDTTVVTFVGANVDSSGLNQVQGWMLGCNPTSGDSIIVSLGGVTKTIGYGEGELMRFRMRVKSSLANGTFSDLIITDVMIDEGQEVIPTTTDGKIIVDNVSILYGDVSGNNEVTTYDGAGIVQYVVGMLELPDDNFPNFTDTVADVSGDGNITSYDAALVFQYSVGLLQQFPVESKFAKDMDAVGLDDFTDAAFTLVKSPLSTGNIVFYDLLAANIRGAISADILLKYDTTKVLVELGGSITTEIYANIESSLDKEKKLLRISITTTDNFDQNNSFKLATIEVPVVDTNSLEGGLLFYSALVNEEEVKNLDPVVITDINFNSNSIDKNLIAVNKLGLIIHNVERLPVSVLMYDIRGRRLIHEQFGASNSSIRISTKSFASGMYVYRVKMGSRIITRSLLIHK